MSDVQQTKLSGGKLKLQEGIESPEWLHELYVERGMSAYKIAKICNSTRGKVKYRLQKYGICRESEKQSKPSEQQLREAYESAGNLKKTQEELEISRHWCYRLMNHYGIERKKSHNWKAPCNFNTNVNGYEVWEHPSSKQFGGHTVLVHRLVMVAEHGVEAVKDMDVHHENTIKWDNRPENLSLLERGEHTRRHFQRLPLSVELANTDKEEVIQAMCEAGYADVLSADYS